MLVATGRRLELKLTNLSLLRSTSCRVGASVLDAAEDLEVVVEVDVVDVDVYWVMLVCITIFSVNFPIVSLRAPMTKRKDTLGHPPTKFGLDMATHQGKSLR